MRANRPSLAKSPHRVLVCESGRTVARASTGSTARSSSVSEESVWVLRMVPAPASRSHIFWRLYDLGQTSGCELCVVMPCAPRRGLGVTRISWVAQESLLRTGPG